MPGTPTLSSGYTSQLAQTAVRCDVARVLARLKGGVSPVCASPVETKAAQPASVLEQLAQRGCPLTAEQMLAMPRAGVPEGERIRRIQQEVLTCSTPPLDFKRRFNNYVRFVPQAPCPPPTAEQLNSTQPMAPMIGCQPSRFF